MAVKLHKGDLPATLDFGPAVAVDTEAMGLKAARDRLCLVQLSAGDGDAHLVQFDQSSFEAPRLKAMLEDRNIVKIFHYARFDVAVLKAYLGADVGPVFCTKVASKLVRTYTDRHGLKDLVRDMLGIDLSKQQQSSDWGAAVRCAEALCRPGRGLSARAQEPARADAEARGPRGAGAGLLRLPFGARRA